MRSLLEKLRKTFGYGVIMEIDLFSLSRRAASSLPPFPEFLSKLAAAESVYAIEKVRHPTGFFIAWLRLSHCIERDVSNSAIALNP